MILSLCSGHQRVFEVQMELAELIDGSAEIPAAALSVEGGGNRNHRFDIAAFDHLIQHRPDRTVIHVEIFACRAAPAMHQVDDVIAGFGVVRVIAIRQVYVSLFLDIRSVSGIILRVIHKFFHRTRMRGLRRIGSGNGRCPARLRNGALSGGKR